MTPAVSSFVTQDKGYKQFCDQYNLVAANPETRNEYYGWVKYHMRIEGELDWAREEGKEQGETLATITIARKMISAGTPIQQVIQFTNLTEAQIEKIQQSL